VIVVGVVNNMQDSALHTTERQFRELLTAAARGRALQLKFFSIPQLPREGAGRAYVDSQYEDVDAIADAGLDGLIVTGTDPRGSVLAEEPYYRPLTKLVDWAEENTVSTVWSCLAAHAAVQHLDGIGRQRFPQKLAGVFDCAVVTEHPVLAGMPARWGMPHSRHNTLPEDALGPSGYQTLSTSPEAGADIFVKQRKSLFLFVQGHPEYDPGALFREYRRDIGRFLSGERENYPDMPGNYFDDATVAALTAFRAEAVQHRDIGILSHFPIAGSGEGMTHAWRAAAEQLYANWLSYLEDHRAERVSRRESSGAAPAHRR
jgi:homoserine O-succinyltransferase